MATAIYNTITILALITLSLAARILLSFVSSRTTVAFVAYDKEHNSLLYRKKETFSSLQWSREYCNPPGREVTGLEGNLPNSSMKLLGAVLLVRHGDRTPISRPPAFEGQPPPQQQPCQLNRTLSPINPLLGQFIEEITTCQKDIKRSLNPSLKNFDLLPDNCSGVTVTQTGIVQMLQLGHFLGQRYFPDGLVSFSGVDILASTTQFSRTFQSLLPLLFGFSPEHFYQILLGGISTSSSIYFCDSDLPENPLYSFHCGCPRALKIPELRASFRSWGMKSPSLSYIHRVLEIGNDRNSHLHKYVKSSMKKIDKPPLSGTSPSRVWDWLVSEYFCTGLPLPCIPNDSSRSPECINSSVIDSLVHLVDKNHLLMIRDADYVKAASLAMYPFLSAVNKKFQELVKEYTDNCSTQVTRQSSRKRFVWIVSGHDVTVGPLFVALKIPLLRKVPYATRVAFELWVNCGESSSRCCDIHKYEVRPYIRVLLNGRDVTGNIGHCGLHRNFYGWKSVNRNLGHSQEAQLCPLSYFDQFLKNDFFEDMNGTNYETACRF